MESPFYLQESREENKHIAHNLNVVQSLDAGLEFEITVWHQYNFVTEGRNFRN